ncbi:MAG TPA: TolC family protein [Spirochaetota bacterium]|nr:TolC family protein [Spirochaetota bacterium]
MSKAGKFFALLPLFFYGALLFIPYQVHSQEIERRDFDSIWAHVKSNSPAIKSASLESEAATVMKDRYSRHWLPMIYGDAKFFITDDPALNFMSVLSQRKIGNEDFSPDRLNHPGKNSYKQASVGVNLPLYEGGAGYYTAKSFDSIAKSKSYGRAVIVLSEKSKTMAAYGRLIALTKAANELADLKKSVTGILSGYESALKNNPVEYSGILGLKALSNRIDAMITENDAKIKYLRDYLQNTSAGNLPDLWTASDSDVITFGGRYVSDKNTAIKESYQLKALKAYAESLKHKAEAQKSVYLPKIGLFSEANVYSGNRATADSYSAGFYIQMNILSPVEYGSVRQAEFESDAAFFKLKNEAIKEKTDIERLRNFEATLRENIKILNESLKIMDEQLRNIKRLFANGSVKAFQLSDVIAAKGDLLQNLAKAEEEYAEVISGIYFYTANIEEASNE